MAMALLTVALLEMVFSAKQDVVSKNLAHINDIPAIARKFDGDHELSILFLGNSYTRRDVRTDIVQEVFAQHGFQDVLVEKIRPDATSVIDWYYLFRRHFSEPARVPDVVVVGFTVRDHLSDERPIDVRLLSGRFCGWSHIPELFRHDVHSFGERAECILSRVFGLLGNQGHIRRRLLDLVIPHYEESTKMVNAVLRRRDREGAVPADVNYTRLQRFVSMARDSGARLIFVAIPGDPQPLDSTLSQLRKTEGHELLDCRLVDGIERRHVVDGFYLNEEGGVLFSRYLATKLYGLLYDP